MLAVTADEMLDIAGGEPRRAERDNWSDSGIRNGNGGYKDPGIAFHVKPWARSTIQAIRWCIDLPGQILDSADRWIDSW